MSVAAYERLHEKLLKLAAIEVAARRVVSTSEWNTPIIGPNHPIKQLVRALRIYDGWEDDDDTVQAVVEDMQAIVAELEAREDQEDPQHS